MELGVHFMNFSGLGGNTQLGPKLAATAQAAEDAGFTLLTMMDHWFQMEGFAPPQEPMLEGYTSLGFVAGKTRRLTLGLMVTGVTYRHPGLLAKIVTALDVLSEGRAMFGIGAAWYQREHEGLGVPYPPISERFERLEETLQICRQMWSDNDGPYEGKYYQLAETICSPRPIQTPGPTILIGGGGEKKTLRLVARYGDACNLFALGYDEVSRKLDVLKAHCETEGRDYDEIKKTMNFAGDPRDDIDGFLRDMERYATLGIELVDVRNIPPDPAAVVSELGETLLPRLSQIGNG
ncbi:MAG TPA: LLM class F420-dependent oxidoreductase [Candidatus Saccharimonadales bacterium]|nr:LLM class F420-dependent oxidoreductase [Candidatus Saccharimonadales bacterium]